MKTLFVIMVLIGCTTTPLYSQIFSANELTVELSDPIKSKKNSYVKLILGDSDRLFSQNTVNWKPYLMSYSEQFVLHSSQRIIPELVPEHARIEAIIPLKNVLLLFFSRTDETEKIKELYVLTLDQDDLTPRGKEKKILDLKFSSKRNSGSFIVSTSRDSTKFLLVANLAHDQSKKENGKMKMVVMDNNLEPLWANEMAIPYSDKNFGMSQFRVDNLGNVYVVGKYYNINLYNQKQGIHWTYKLFKYSEDEENPLEFDLAMPEKSVTSSSYKISQDGNILYSGLYTSITGSFGTFYIELEGETLEVILDSYNDLDISNNADHSNKTLKGKSQSKEVMLDRLRSYKIRDMLESEAGGLIMIAEQHHVKVVNITSTQANSAKDYHHHYNDILIVRLDEEGEIKWNEKIEKFQYSLNDGGIYSGYNMTIKNDKMHFYFVDNGWNKSLGFDKKKNKKEWRSDHLIYVSVNFDGVKKVQSMGMVEPDGFIPIPKRFKSTQDGRTWIMLKGKAAYKIGVINPD